MMTMTQKMKQIVARVLTLGAVLGLAASAANAETLLMPKRDTRIGGSTVIWGVSTLSNGTAFTLDYGDSTPVTAGNVSDRSYIAFNHTYTTGGSYTVTLTVGAEVATTTVQAFDPASFGAGPAALAANRSLGINMAIQDGLRYLWVSQSNRAGGFPAAATTNWGNSFPYADAALIVLAFENHGYKLTGNVAPTGLYEKYIVR